MPKISAGILLYRIRDGRLEVLLVHPGGPHFRGRDEHVWSIPKGEVDPGEDLLAAARREFREETGVEVSGDMLPLHPIIQKSGKVVHAWACEGDCEPRTLRSNTFKMEWPPHSGQFIDVPEVDRAEWFPVQTALKKINPAQAALIEELVTRLRLAGRLGD